MDNKILLPALLLIGTTAYAADKSEELVARIQGKSQSVNVTVTRNASPEAQLLAYRLALSLYEQMSYLEQNKVSSATQTEISVLQPRATPQPAVPAQSEPSCFKCTDCVILYEISMKLIAYSLVFAGG